MSYNKETLKKKTNIMNTRIICNLCRAHELIELTDFGARIAAACSTARLHLGSMKHFIGQGRVVACDKEIELALHREIDRIPVSP